LQPLVEDADVVLLNIEGAIGEGPAPRKCREGSTSCYAFRQPPYVAGAIRRFADGAEAVGNVANNHASDAGVDGWHTGIGHLREAGVHVTGADTLATLVVTADADTLAVLGFSTFVAGPDARDLRAVRRHVARAFARYGRVLVSVHMGGEGRGAQRTRDATERFLGEDRGNPVAFARTALASGASLVIGHGPHVLRATQWQGDALVFYSLGNLLTYGPFNFRAPMDVGGFACATLDRAGRVVEASFRSTYQVQPGLAYPDAQGRGAVLVDSLGRLDFPETGGRVSNLGDVVRRQ
jgi:poly-gamma-glutamate capsule biosynthesis protein CapA/YwtB (metallophosphatase superfamily)